MLDLSLKEDNKKKRVRTNVRTPLASSSEDRKRRRPQPLNQQLPATAKWAASLPEEIQPRALLKGFRELRMPSPVCGRTTLGCGCTWMNSCSTDAGGAADSHPKFTTSCWY